VLVFGNADPFSNIYVAPDHVSGWGVPVYRLASAILTCSFLMSPVWAARIAQFSPQGTVAQIQELSLSFDTDVMAFGEGQGPAPVRVSCNDPGLKGNGRW